jgi:hypothetical protein
MAPRAAKKAAQAALAAAAASQPAASTSAAVALDTEEDAVKLANLYDPAALKAALDDCAREVHMPQCIAHEGSPSQPDRVPIRRWSSRPVMRRITP